MTCNPRSANGHGYIIIVINYFTKWAEVMPTYNVDGTNVSQFLFNHVIALFASLKPLSLIMALNFAIT